MPQIDCICGIFALHGIILHQGHGFVKGFSAIFLEKGKKRRNTKKLPKKRACLLCILLFMKPLPRRAESRFAEPRSFPEREGSFCHTFCTLQKVWKKPPRAAEGFKFVCAWSLFWCADSRFAKPRSFPVRETDWYFLRRAKSTAKTRRGLRPSGLPGTIQSSVEEDFSKVFRRHEPNPVFRTKRRRKGFESVRGSGVTARGVRAEIKRTASFFRGQ